MAIVAFLQGCHNHVETLHLELFQPWYQLVTSLWQTYSNLVYAGYPQPDVYK